MRAGICPVRAPRERQGRARDGRRWSLSALPSARTPPRRSSASPSAWCSAPQARTAAASAVRTAPRAAARLRRRPSGRRTHRMTKCRDTRPSSSRVDELAVARERDRLDRDAGLLRHLAHDRLVQRLAGLDHAARQREHAGARALARRATSTWPSRMIAALTARNGRSGYMRGSVMSWISCFEQRVDGRLLLAGRHVFRRLDVVAVDHRAGARDQRLQPRRGLGRERGRGVERGALLERLAGRDQQRVHGVGELIEPRPARSARPPHRRRSRAPCP